MKILFPGKASSLHLNEKDWQNTASYLKDYDRNDIIPILTNYFTILAETRVVFPENYDEVKPNQHDWRIMMDMLQYLRSRKDWRKLAQHARDMKILAAEKVKPTDEGLKTVMLEKKSFGEESHLPETRKF